MKSTHLIPALALALSLAACNGESPQPANGAHADEAAGHGTEADEQGHRLRPPKPPSRGRMDHP